MMKICSNEDISKEKVMELFKLHWGSPMMVISTGVYNCSELDAFAAVNEEGETIGLITYVIKDNECEIISLEGGDGIPIRDEIELIKWI